MNKYYLGLDIGKIYVKGVIINNNKYIIATSKIRISKDIISSVIYLIKILNNKINNHIITNIGVTGIYRKYIAKLLKINSINNEIITHTIGTKLVYKNINTIIELNKNISKVIIIDNNKIIDHYIINIPINNIIKYKDYIDKIINKTKSPILIQGIIKKELIDIIKNKKIIIDTNSYYYDALGAAILSMNNKEYNLNIKCNNCNKNCKIISLNKNNKTIYLKSKDCKQIDIKVNNI